MTDSKISSVLSAQICVLCLGAAELPCPKVAGPAARPAQKYPLELCAVALGRPARRAAVGGDIILMKNDIILPGGRVGGIQPPHMALGTGRSAPLNSAEIASMAGAVGARSRTVQGNIISMQGVGVSAPQNRMHGFLVPHVALITGNICGSAGEIVSMTVGAYGGIPLCRRRVSFGHPSGRVNTAHGLGPARPCAEIGIRAWISAAGQIEDEK